MVILPQQEPSEVWRDVPGYEGLYKVSSIGRVYSMGRTKVTPRGNQRWPARMLARFIDTTGYFFVGLTDRSGRTKKQAVHRLVLLAFVGPCPKGYQACHADGDRTNARVENLRWDSVSANAADRIAHGTQVRGEQSPQAKLTSDQVDEIRQRSESSLALAAVYGVASSTIRAVRLRQNWAHQ